MATGKGLPVLPSDLMTANDQFPRYTPGETSAVDTRNGCEFAYVKVTIGGTTANTLYPGRPVYWDSRNAGTTKTDQGGTDKEFAGILCSTLTSTYCGWICTKGPFFAVVAGTGGTTATNVSLIPDPSVGGLKIAGNVATDRVVGTNLAATTTNTALRTADVAPTQTVTIVNGAISAVTLVTAGTVPSSCGGIVFDGLPGAGGVVTATVVSNAITAWAVSTAGGGYSSTNPPLVIAGVTRCMIGAMGS